MTILVFSFLCLRKYILYNSGHTEVAGILIHV